MQQVGQRGPFRLRWQTALAGIIIFLVPFLSFLAVANSTSETRVRQETLARLQGGVTANVDLFEDVLAVRLAETQSLARTLAHSNGRPRSWPEMLREFAEYNPWYSTVLVADPAGHILASSQPLAVNVSVWHGFLRATYGEANVSELFLAQPSNAPAMIVSAPLRDSNARVTGVLVASLKLEKLSSRLLRLSVGETEAIFLVNTSGQLVSPSHKGEALLSQTVFAPGTENPFRGEQGKTDYRDARGETVWAAYRRLRTKPYYLVAEVHRSEMERPIADLRRTILLYVAPFLTLGILLALVIWHYGTRRIERLTGELWQALQVARQREQERDLAHKELARRFEEERELARQKSQFQAQLAEYEKYAALAQLALGAAHEINNPLLGILSHLELELRATNDGDRRDEILQCIEGTKRISTTVRGLLNYARPVPLRLSNVSLAQLVNDSIAFLRHQPLFRSIKLEQQIPPDLPPITADASQLSQILMNLLLNAAEAMPEGGQITVSAGKVKFEEKVEIRVTDTGFGIPADVLPRIFEPFFTTKTGKGTGLGLSISQSYIRGHQGEIQVDSVPRRGTTVRIILPIRQEEREVGEREEVIV